MKKYFIITYGCQANMADSERIAAKLEKDGYKQAQKIDDADLIVINSCSVRQSAVNRVYGKLRNLSANLSALGGKKIILAGCLLEHDKKKLQDKVNDIWHPDEYF
ncbi:MAG: tRNA (N6-isopentenyl adenosine(37)-C2)-methylthiotransferase MiaB, partial [Patescibacteria group bacterium]